jgi:hypothetical protein
MASLAVFSSRHLSGFFLVLLWLCCSPQVRAQSSVDLEWDPPLSSSPAGYRVYYGPSTRHYTNSVDAGAATKVRVCCLSPGGTYFFASTAYKANGEESVPSAEFVYRVPDPNALRVSPVSDVVLLPNSPGTVSFQVRLGRTALANLNVRLTSSNTGFLPESNLVVRASGTNFSVSLLPTAGLLGSASVMITAVDLTDPSRVATEQFGVSVTSLESASTMNAIGNRSIAEDSPLQTIVLAGIGSPITKSGGTLRITATSSNPGLIPHPTVNYSSPATSGSLTLAPSSNASGLATITVALKDVGSGLTLVTRTFNVSVWEVNDAPTLNALPDLGLLQNAPRQVVTLSGIGSGAPNELQSLVIRATSSNPAIIPNPVVTYSSPGIAGTLAFAPVANASGASTITVRVDDGHTFNNLTTRTFTVSVTGSNSAPTLDTLPNRSIAEDSGIQTVALTRIATANGNATAKITAISSNPGLIPHPKVNYQSPSTTGTLSFAPLANVAGIARITVTLDDGRGTPSSKLVRSFNVSVWDVNDPPTLGPLADLILPSNPGLQTVVLPSISSGAANEPQSLRVSAVSSNPSLIPHPRVIYNSPDTTGTLTFSPNPGAAGLVSISVQVDDGQGFNSVTKRSFTVVLGSASPLASIEPLADRLISEDGGLQTVAVRVLTPNGRGSSFRLTATSSNPSLIPSPEIVGPDAEGAAGLSFRPAPDATGSASISVILDDGRGTLQSLVTNEFHVVVVEVNDPPTMNPISNRTISLDSPVHTVPLAGISSGAPNEVQPVVITAISSDPTCIPDPVIRYSGPASTGSLILTPVPNSTGSSTITVSVTDGQSTNSTLTRIFNVKVNAPAGNPSIDPIPGLRIAEDSGVQTVHLTGISSPFGPGAPTISVTASSSNPSLIPDPSISYVSGSTVGKLTFVAVPDAVGFATISVAVQDSLDPENVAVTTFAVWVLEVNDPPYFDPIPELNVDEDSGTHSLEITGVRAGPDNEAQGVTFRAVSSNPSVVPHPQIHYEEGSDKGSLQLIPVENAAGTAVITVLANDGQPLSALASRSFVVTVSPENDLPTLGLLADLVLEEDAAFQSISLTGITSGAANEFEDLTVTASSSDPSVIPDPTIVYESPGSTGILLLAPAPDAFGRTRIQITVSDGHGQNSQVTRSFEVTVNAVDDLPTLDSIQDLELEEDFSAHHLTLTGIGTGAPNEFDPMVLSATSSNPLVLPNPSLSHSEGDSVASLWLTPVPDAFGSALVEVRVADALNPTSTTVQSFLVHVKPVNDTPTLAELPDLVVYSDSGPQVVELLQLTPGAPNENDSLSIRTGSSDPGFFQHLEVTSAGPAGSGKLTFTPSVNASGSAQIFVTVEDGQPQHGFVQRTFNLLVTSPPTNQLWFEAELGAVEDPLTTGSHTNASGGAFVFSPSAQTGAVSVLVEAPRAASYVLWARVQPPDLATNLFHVSVDGGPEFSWSVTNSFRSAPLHWIRAEAELGSDPRLFFWQAGAHTLRLRAGQENVILDAIYLTTDRQGLPPGEAGALDPEQLTESLPPYPWIATDIGAPPTPGSARFVDADGRFKIRGSGSIGGSSDSFHYVHQPLNGDGVITAKLSSARGSGADELIGLMIRQNLAADSPYVFIGTSGMDDLILQSRGLPGTESVTDRWTLSLPAAQELWIQLSREGESIYAFAQTDGVAWQLIATIPAAWAPELFFGMAVASEDPQNLALPIFSGVIAAP